LTGTALSGAMLTTVVVTSTMNEMKRSAEEEEKEKKRLQEARHKREQQEAKKPTPEELKQIAKQRQRMVDEMAKKKEKRAQQLEKLFNTYDSNKSGVLEEDQVKKLLTDLDEYTPPGTDPTEEELDYVLKVADTNKDNSISLEELENAIKVWDAYLKNRDEMTRRLKHFDKSGDGKLGPDELKAYLTKLNGGMEVTDEEVAWVLREADVFGDGQIGLTEMVKATAAWYVHPRPRRKANAETDEEKKQGCACTVL